MKELLKKITEEYKKKSTINEKLKNEILELSTSWNENEVMNKMIQDMEDFELYEEEEFPYISYVDLFLGSGVK